MLDQRLALGGQADTPLVTVEEGELEAMLQVGDGLADRGLGQVQRTAAALKPPWSTTARKTPRLRRSKGRAIRQSDEFDH